MNALSPYTTIRDSGSVKLYRSSSLGSDCPFALALRLLEPCRQLIAAPIPELLVLRLVDRLRLLQRPRPLPLWRVSATELADGPVVRLLVRRQIPAGRQLPGCLLPPPQAVDPGRLSVQQQILSSRGWYGGAPRCSVYAAYIALKSSTFATSSLTNRARYPASTHSARSDGSSNRWCRSHGLKVFRGGAMGVIVILVRRAPARHRGLRHQRRSTSSSRQPGRWRVQARIGG